MKQAFYKPLFMIASAILVNLGSLFVPVAQASTSVVVSGRIYNATTGIGYPGATVSLCNSGKTAVTDGSGVWEALIPYSGSYCARVVAGIPAGVTGPATLNQPDVGTVSTYEYQIAGVNCYHNSACAAPTTSWDRATDNNTDFIYRNAAAATPKPTPVPTPVPTTPKPTPQPTVQSTPQPTAAPVPAPATFTAKTGDATDVINLEWAEVSGATYVLERSLDQSTWTTVNDKLTATSYKDIGLKPDVTYYYRLVAQIGAAKSTPVTANAKTAAILATSTVASTSTTSDDKLATASVPTASLPTGASCKVAQTDAPKPASGTKTLAGTYQLVCTTASGEALSLSGQTVSWSLALGSLTQGYNDPVAIGYDAQAKPVSVASHYDAKTRTLSFSASPDLPVAASATIPNLAWLNWVAVALVGLMIVVAVLFLPLRHQRRLNYQEYLRQKYYNL